MEKLKFKQVKKFLLDCAGCGKKHLPLNEIYEGKSYCQVCKENIAKCAKSGSYHLKNEMTYFKAQDIYVMSPDESLVSKSCVSRKNIYRGSLKVAAIEGKEIDVRDKDNMYALVEEFERNGYVLLSSGKYIKKKETIGWGGKIYKTNGLSKQLRAEGKLISNYSFKPEPVFKKTVELGHKGSGIPYLGFELELSVKPIHSGEVNSDGQYSSIDAVDKDRCNDAAEGLFNHLLAEGLQDSLYFKSDASALNGFEIVSHPSTLSHWKTVDFRKFFEKTKELGMEEHHSCGLHVHVSKDALTKKQWWVLMVFLSKNANKLLKLSRRDRGKTRYCKMKANINSGVMAALVEGKGIFDTMPPKNTDRSAAINFNPQNSVEFRLFKSTDSAEELYASLSLVEALVMFAKEYSFMFVQDSRTSELWDEFTNFCKIKGYGSLNTFMEKMDLISNKVKKNEYVCA